MKIIGTFEVKLSPLDAYAQSTAELKLGHLSIDKTFKGELDAVSKGEMLSALTSVKGSAGYVAIEHVSGTLSGKKGSFVLQHFGMMDRGNSRLILEVVPDSGTEELRGLTGTMSIEVIDGQHRYELDYALT